MEKSHYIRTTCRLCGDSNIVTVLMMAPTPPGDHYVRVDSLKDRQEDYPLYLIQCANCGHVELPVVVNPQILYGKYIYETSISLGLVEHYRNYADEIVTFARPSSGSLVIDVGSNDGTLLRAFKAKGFRVLGVDPAKDIAAKATNSGVLTIPSYLTGNLALEIGKEHGSASVVTANNVMANIDDLSDFVASIRSLLEPNGVFVFETGYLADLVKHTIIDNIYHEHLSYFSVKPLVSFFDRNGMELIHVLHNPSKGGSIRGIVQLKGGGRPVSDSVKRLIEAENEFGLGEPAVYGKLSEKVKREKEELLDRVRGLRKEGRRIAGYGASVGVTTLIHFFEINDLIDCIFDDNPIRDGLFTPGHHIPVFRSEKIYEKSPDYIVNFAWRYTDPILQRHQKYMASGGKFIVPLPEVRVI